MTDIRKAQWFSVIADEASDVSNKEQLSVCIRWVDDKFSVYEDPLELINLSKTDVATITNALRDCQGFAYPSHNVVIRHMMVPVT